MSLFWFFGFLILRKRKPSEEKEEVFFFQQEEEEEERERKKEDMVSQDSPSQRARSTFQLHHLVGLDLDDAAREGDVVETECNGLHRRSKG